MVWFIIYNTTTLPERRRQPENTYFYKELNSLCREIEQDRKLTGQCIRQSLSGYILYPEHWDIRNCAFAWEDRLDVSRARKERKSQGVTVGWNEGMNIFQPNRLLSLGSRLKSIHKKRNHTDFGVISLLTSRGTIIAMTSLWNGFDDQERAFPMTAIVIDTNNQEDHGVLGLAREHYLSTLFSLLKAHAPPDTFAQFDKPNALNPCNSGYNQDDTMLISYLCFTN